jgi:hypothetical protein
VTAPPGLPLLLTGDFQIIVNSLIFIVFHNPDKPPGTRLGTRLNLDLQPAAYQCFDSTAL